MEEEEKLLQREQTWVECISRSWLALNLRRGASLRVKCWASIAVIRRGKHANETGTDQTERLQVALFRYPNKP